MCVATLPGTVLRLVIAMGLDRHEVEQLFSSIYRAALSRSKLKTAVWTATRALRPEGNSFSCDSRHDIVAAAKMAHELLNEKFGFQAHSLGIAIRLARPWLSPRNDEAAEEHQCRSQ